MQKDQPQVNAFTTSDGLRIAYHRSGTGPALVILHGFIADGRVWRAQIDDSAVTSTS